MPGDVSAELTALVEPLAVGLHAVRLAGVQAGERVLIAGAGMIGIAALLMALRHGASEVVVSEPQPGRRAAAAALGATVLDPLVGEGAGPSSLRTRAFDRAIDAVGISATLNACVSATAVGGTIAVVGMGSPAVDLDLFALVRSERRIIGSYTYTVNDFEDSARWLASGDVSFSGLPMQTVSFASAPEAFLDLAEGPDVATKAFFVPELAG
jgi:L-iditol 2-dehydrogenase